jgi:hypothetical protein
MKRLALATMCLIAPFVLTALIAASAGAEEELLVGVVCVAEKKGDFTEGGCETGSRKPHKGTFELVPDGGCFPDKGGQFENGGCTELAKKKGKFEEAAPGPNFGKVDVGDAVEKGQLIGTRIQSIVMGQAVVNPATGPFSVVAAKDTCSNLTRPKNVVCHINVQFKPTAAGKYKATLELPWHPESEPSEQRTFAVPLTGEA